MLVIVSNPIHLELLRGTSPQRWRILRDVTVQIGAGAHRHLVTVRRGLVTDFASVPKFIRPLFPDRICYGVGALVHDHLYKSGEVGKVIADALLKGLLLDCDGAAEWQAEIFFQAVHLFGFVAWRKHRLTQRRQDAKTGATR